MEDKGSPIYKKETMKDQKLLMQYYLDNYAKIKQFPKQPLKEIRTWQFQRIKWLVKHAYETVPVYSKKYKEANFHPDQLKTLEDFQKVPILTKDELIAAWPNNAVSNAHSLEFTTRSSGSSGKFVSLAVNKEAVMRDTVIGVRQLEFQSNNTVTSEDVIVQIYTCPWWFNSIGGLYRSVFLPTTEPYERASQIIRALKPGVLALYPSYLKPLSQYLDRIEEIGVKLVVSHSEQSTPLERKKLSEKLGVNVLDEYSSEELTRIALECPQRNYHVEEDSCYVEIVDETGDILEPNNKGEIIGTNLLNEATPLIRYKQEDIAQLSDRDSCACGSSFSQISEILGRKGDFVLTPSGRVIAPGTLMDAVYHWFLNFDIPIHGLQYQMLQTKLDAIVLTISGQELNDKQLAIIRNQLQYILGTDMAIEIKFVDKIDNKNWKHKCVISKVNKNTK